MAIFTPSITIETINSCQDLKITDTSVFTSPLTEDVFTSRTITITQTDGTITTYNFPIGLSIDNFITLSNFLNDKDYYITVTIDYEFDNVGTPDTATISLNHISTCNALLGRSQLLLDIDCSCTDTAKCNISNLAKIDTSIENSIYAASFSLGEISQEFLDQSLNLINSLKSDCGC